MLNRQVGQNEASTERRPNSEISRLIWEPLKPTLRNGSAGDLSVFGIVGFITVTLLMREVLRA